jgi:MFS family permease
MWALAVCFVFFQFFLQLSAGVIVNQLRASFHLTALGAGMMAGSFYYVYTLLQMPAGALIERYGARYLLGLGGLVCGAACLCFALSQETMIAFFSRLVMGAGASFAFVASLYLVEQWFPPHRFALMTGLAETIGMMGVLAGNLSLAHALKTTPWRSTMATAALIAGTLGLLCYLIIRDRPSQTSPLPKIRTTATPYWQQARTVIKHPLLWLNGLYAGLMFNVVTVFSALWAVPFLIQAQQVPLPTATTETALLFIGIAIGSPLMGMVYPLLRYHNIFLMSCALLTAVPTSILIYTTPDNVLVTGGLFLLTGILCSAYVLNYAIANHSVPKAIRSSSVGFTNMLCLFTTPILQPLIGYLLHLFSTAYNTQGQELYSLYDYHRALALIPLCLLIAGVIAYFLPHKAHPTH